MRQGDLDKIKELRLFDDDFMQIVFKDDQDCVNEVLKVVYPYEGKINSFHVEDSLKNLSGKDVKYDVIIEGIGIVIDLEVQRKKSEAHPKRALLYESLLNARSTFPTRKWEQLPDTVVIFIIEKDYFKKGEAIYHIERYVKEIGEPFQDGSLILYINGEYRGNDKLGSLMHDFHQKDYRNIHNKILKEKVRQLKETEEGRQKMCQIFEDIRNEARKEGRTAGMKAGKRQQKLDDIRSIMKEFDIDVERAMQVLKISISEKDYYRERLMHLRS